MIRLELLIIFGVFLFLIGLFAWSLYVDIIGVDNKKWNKLQDNDEIEHVNLKKR